MKCDTPQAMRLPATLLLTYQEEFENTDITIEQLCEKYDVTTKQLKGYTKWKKIPSLAKQATIAEPTNNHPITPVEVIDVPIAKEDVQTNIDLFKQKAVEAAVKFIDNDLEFAEVKEFKDMVAIVDSIEKSYKDTKPQGPTINIAIQNLVERFTDDC